MTLSIILPAKNEGESLRSIVPELGKLYPKAEIIVVDDGSSDETARVAQKAGARVVAHPFSLGNGAAIKAGARAARGDILAFMDADGQHKPEELQKLIAKLDEGNHMVVGARDISAQASRWRMLANSVYNRLSSWIVGHPILDLTSGFRVARAESFKKFLYLLPNGFSYPTTITMAFFRAGLPVGYAPVEVGKRIGKSHVRPMRDGLKFLLIIFKVGTLYSPLKIFLPVSLFFFLSGIAYYVYTYAAFHRFTNMSALLLISAVFIGLIGLVSEQITALNYKDSE